MDLWGFIKGFWANKFKDKIFKGLIKFELLRVLLPQNQKQLYRKQKQIKQDRDKKENLKQTQDLPRL